MFKKFLLALLALLAVTIGNVQAAIPAELTTMFTDAKTDSALLITSLVIPAVALITGLWVLIRMGKKGAGKIS